MRPGTERASLTPPPRGHGDDGTRHATAATARHTPAAGPTRCATLARGPGTPDNPREQPLARGGRSAGSGIFCQAAKTPAPVRERVGGAASPDPRRRPHPFALAVFSQRSPARRPPSEGDEAALARQEEPGSGGLGPRAPTRAPTRRNTGDRRSAAPAAVARGSKGRPPPPLSGGDGPAADRRSGGGGGGKEGWSRRDGDERTALRCPAATRGVAQGGPCPRARWRARTARFAAPSGFLSPPHPAPPGAARLPSLWGCARGAVGKGAWPPRVPAEAGGRGAERASERTERAFETPHAAGRTARHAGRRQPPDSQVRPSSRHSGRAVADPAGADPRTSLNHPIGSSDGRINQVAATHGGATEAREQRGPPGPTGQRPANPDRPGSFTAPTRGSGIADATVAAWQRRQPASGGRRHRKPGGAWGGERQHGTGTFPPPLTRRKAAERRGTPSATADPGGRPFPRRRGQGAGTAAQLSASDDAGLSVTAPPPPPGGGKGTPEGSRGHAAVTQPGTVKTPSRQRERRHLACDGKRIGKETALPEHRTPPWLPHYREPRKSRPAGGPFRRDPKSLIDRLTKEERKKAPRPRSWDNGSPKRAPTGRAPPRFQAGSGQTDAGLLFSTGGTRPREAPARGLAPPSLPDAPERPPTPAGRLRSGFRIGHSGEARGGCRHPTPAADDDSLYRARQHRDGTNRGREATAKAALPTPQGTFPSVRGSATDHAHGPPAFARLAAIGFPPEKPGGNVDLLATQPAGNHGSRDRPDTTGRPSVAAQSTPAENKEGRGAAASPAAFSQGSLSGFRSTLGRQAGHRRPAAAPETFPPAARVPQLRAEEGGRNFKTQRDGGGGEAPPPRRPAATSGDSRHRAPRPTGRGRGKAARPTERSRGTADTPSTGRQAARAVFRPCPSLGLGSRDKATRLLSRSFDTLRSGNRARGRRSWPSTQALTQPAGTRPITRSHNTDRRVRGPGRLQENQSYLTGAVRWRTPPPTMTQLEAARNSDPLVNFRDGWGNRSTRPLPKFAQVPPEP
ncbi:collagen alpha-1(I) chain-like, partial [Corvus hawaiiensis]|uniref:collagen alpha-1(I) chain-like n=1 Tax=Corvus hawaiiensis TaxID=134902 RepID=UPI002019C45E